MAIITYTSNAIYPDTDNTGCVGTSANTYKEMWGLCGIYGTCVCSPCIRGTSALIGGTVCHSGYICTESTAYYISGSSSHYFCGSSGYAPIYAAHACVACWLYSWGSPGYVYAYYNCGYYHCSTYMCASTGMNSSGYMCAGCFYASGQAGINFNGAITNLTVCYGIVTAAS